MYCNPPTAARSQPCAAGPRRACVCALTHQRVLEAVPEVLAVDHVVRGHRHVERGRVAQHLGWGRAGGGRPKTHVFARDRTRSRPGAVREGCMRT